MTIVPVLEMLVCISFGLFVFARETREVVRARQLINSGNLREGDRRRQSLHAWKRGAVAATAAVMVMLLSVLIVR